MISEKVLKEVKANLIEICSKKDLIETEHKRLLGISASKIYFIEEIKNNFSKEDLSRELEKIIQSAKTVGQEKIEKTIDESLHALDKYFDNQIGDWCFVLPLINVTTNKEVKIGKVRLFVFTKEDEKAVEEYTRQIFEKNTYYNETEKSAMIKLLVERFATPLVGQTCAEVVLRGSEKAKHDLAFDEISKALSLIKLYGEVDDTLGQYFGLTGEVAPSVARLTLTYRADGNGFSPSMERIGPLVPFHLSDELLKEMNKHGFQKLLALNNKENKEDFDTRILTSINWYGKACDVQTLRKGEGQTVEVEMIKLSDKLVKITTAIESLLVFNEQESVTVAVSERTAALLALNKQTFDEIRKFMSDMYAARSAIVHHGKMSFTKGDLDRFQYYVRNAIICLIDNLDAWGIKNENDFFYWIEKERIEYKYNKHPEERVGQK